MATQKISLNNLSWVLIGSGAHDLQRELSSKTIYLHVADSVPSYLENGQFRLNFNQIYSYKGTQKIWAKSSDKHANILSTPIISGFAAINDAQTIKHGMLFPLHSERYNNYDLDKNLIETTFKNEGQIVATLTHTYQNNLLISSVLT